MATSPSCQLKILRGSSDAGVSFRRSQRGPRDGVDTEKPEASVAKGLRLLDATRGEPGRESAAVLSPARTAASPRALHGSSLRSRPTGGRREHRAPPTRRGGVRAASSPARFSRAGLAQGRGRRADGSYLGCASRGSSRRLSLRGILPKCECQAIAAWTLGSYLSALASSPTEELGDTTGRGSPEERRVLGRRGQPNLPAKSARAGRGLPGGRTDSSPGITGIIPRSVPGTPFACGCPPSHTPTQLPSPASPACFSARCSGASPDPTRGFNRGEGDADEFGEPNQPLGLMGGLPRSRRRGALVRPRAAMAPAGVWLVPTSRPGLAARRCYPFRALGRTPRALHFDIEARGLEGSGSALEGAREGGVVPERGRGKGSAGTLNRWRIVVPVARAAWRARLKMAPRKVLDRRGAVCSTPWGVFVGRIMIARHPRRLHDHGISKSGRAL